MMKKKLVSILAVCLCFVSLSACSNGGSGDQEKLVKEAIEKIVTAPNEEYGKAVSNGEMKKYTEETLTKEMSKYFEDQAIAKAIETKSIFTFYAAGELLQKEIKVVETKLDKSENGNQYTFTTTFKIGDQEEKDAFIGGMQFGEDGKINFMKFHNVPESIEAAFMAFTTVE